MIVRALVLLSLFLAAGAAAAQDSFSDRIRAAMEAEIRTEAERDRDANRRPVETLEFFGIESDMKVLELVPGGGWYAKLLAPALAADGEYVAAIGTSRLENNLMGLAGFEQAKALSIELETERDPVLRQTSIKPFSFGETGFDAALTFRNMHNFTEEGRRSVNVAVFEALKPGGVYGVVDHTRRHMEPQWSENRRRIDPVVVIHEVLDAGFEFVGYSDLHYKSDDELRFEVGRRAVSGNSDRFTLLFRKPE
ncbi:MAG: methyltransferase [Pseudomonadota bacterium]